MRLPNGYGNVSKLTGKHKRPWRARKTVGWTDEGKQLHEIIGYYKTRQEALAEYNANPYDLNADKLTFKDVYDKWSEEHFEKLTSAAGIRTYKSAFNHCAPVHDMLFRDIKVNHIESTIKKADVGDVTKGRIRGIFISMFKWAMKHEIVAVNYGEMSDPVKKPKTAMDRIPFTETEIQNLWNAIDFPFVDMVLVEIYSGWRPSELCTLRTANIDFENKTMKGGAKTKAGKNRIVPIHSKILHLVEKNYNPDNEFLFNDENGQQGTTMTYNKYRCRFIKIMDHLQIEHKPHDTRHTFVTFAKKFNMDEYVLKLIVSHTIEDITESVYTHRTVENLKLEIEKIKV